MVRRSTKGTSNTGSTVRSVPRGGLPGSARGGAGLGCPRGFRGLAGPLLRDYGVAVNIKHDETRAKGEFKPLQPLWKVEAAFSDLGRWRRLARSFEGTTASATAWMQVAAVGYMLTLL